ncbi:MAG: hypothetical protein EBS01_02395 [Verrucomicrobia bacterium]|nr:hypothetical protein [Verrucomicrobiota bacterium]
MRRTLWGAAVRQTGVLLGLATIPAVLAIASDWHWKAPTEFRELSAGEARLLMPEIIWVDARNGERFTQQRVPGAIAFDEVNPALALERIRAAWTPSKTLVVYGEGAGSERASRIARVLKGEFKTQKVRLLRGGWAAWPREPETVQSGADVK